jgi:hypothetical protein
LEGEAASALIFHPISKPTVNDYVPFFGVPAPPPTDREILKKQKPTAQKFFGKKTECRHSSTRLKSAAITGSIRRRGGG